MKLIKFSAIIIVFFLSLYWLSCQYVLVKSTSDNGAQMKVDIRTERSVQTKAGKLIPEKDSIPDKPLKHETPTNGNIEKIQPLKKKG